MGRGSRDKAETAKDLLYGRRSSVSQRKEPEPVIDEHGSRRWYDAIGRPHRQDGPAVERDDGYQEWRWCGRRHRSDGPAVIYSGGGEEWWHNHQLHREDGPAVERADGSKEWWLSGKRHRQDGPAIVEDGRQRFFIDDKELSEEEFRLRAS